MFRSTGPAAAAAASMSFCFSRSLLICLEGGWRGGVSKICEICEICAMQYAMLEHRREAPFGHI